MATPEELLEDYLPSSNVGKSNNYYDEDSELLDSDLAAYDAFLASQRVRLPSYAPQEQTLPRDTSATAFSEITDDTYGSREGPDDGGGLVMRAHGGKASGKQKKQGSGKNVVDRPRLEEEPVDAAVRYGADAFEEDEDEDAGGRGGYDEDFVGDGNDDDADEAHHHPNSSDNNVFLKIGDMVLTNYDAKLYGLKVKRENFVAPSYIKATPKGPVLTFSKMEKIAKAVPPPRGGFACDSDALNCKFHPS